MGFLSAFAKIKGKQAKDMVNSLAVSWDTEAAIEADIAVKASNLQELVDIATDATNQYNKEQQDVIDILAKQDNMLAGLEILQADLEAANEAGNAEEAAAIEKDIEDAVTELEGMQADIEREKQEAEDAKAEMARMDEVCKAERDELLALRGRAEKAKTLIRQNKAQLARAEREAAMSEKVAGLTGGSSTKADVGIAALEKQAAELEKKADSKSKMAKLLAPEPKSDRLAKAMNRAKTGASPKASVQDRLAALKAKNGK